MAASRTLVIAIAALALVATQQLCSLSFVAGAQASPRRAPRVARSQAPFDKASALLDPARGQVLERVEELRVESLIACIRATEASPEDVRRCAELSAELFKQEELLGYLEAKKQDGGAFWYEDSY